MVENQVPLSSAGAKSAVVDVVRTIGANDREVVGIERAEGGQHLEVTACVVPDQIQGRTRPFPYLRKFLQKLVPLLDGQILVDATRDCSRPVNLLTRGDTDDFLAVLAQQDTLRRQLRVLGGDGEDMAFAHVRTKSEQKVG